MFLQIVLKILARDAGGVEVSLFVEHTAAFAQDSCGGGVFFVAALREAA